ncbi:MAG: hypothetical protein AAF938_09455 [Myxococcota bacterium]
MAIGSGDPVSSDHPVDRILSALRAVLENGGIERIAYRQIAQRAEVRGGTVAYLLREPFGALPGGA